MGLLAVWCQFAQTIFYYPALLAYVASTLAYVFDPGLASNGVYNAVVIIVLFWGGVLVYHTRAGACGQARLGRNPARDADPGRDPRRARRRVPGPGPPLGRADDRPPHPAGVDRAGQHRPDRQQLLHLRRHRSQRRARRRTPESGPRVPEVHLRGHGAGPGRLHRPDAGDLLGDPLGSDQLHRRRDAGLQQPVRPLRRRVRRAADRDRPGGRSASRDDFLAGRPVRGAAVDRARAGVPPALLPEGRPARHRVPHPRRAGRRDHGHRAALRVHPERLARLLDLRRDGHAGVPDHVRADVHRGASGCAGRNRIARAVTGPRRWACCACSAPSRPRPRS